MKSAQGEVEAKLISQITKITLLASPGLSRTRQMCSRKEEKHPELGYRQPVVDRASGERGRHIAKYLSRKNVLERNSFGEM